MKPELLLQDIGHLWFYSEPITIAVRASPLAASGLQGIAPGAWRASGEGAGLHWPRGCPSLWSAGGNLRHVPQLSL